MNFFFFLSIEFHIFVCFQVLFPFCSFVVFCFCTVLTICCFVISYLFILLDFVFLCFVSLGRVPRLPASEIDCLQKSIFQHKTSSNSNSCSLFHPVSLPFAMSFFLIFHFFFMFQFLHFASAFFFFNFFFQFLLRFCWQSPGGDFRASAALNRER